MTPMITHGGSITVNPLGIPSIHDDMQCARSKRCGKKCLSKIYLRSAPTNFSCGSSINSEPSKISRELPTTEAVSFPSATLNSKPDNKFFEFVGFSKISSFSTKLSNSKSAHKRKISSKSGLECKETSGGRNSMVFML